MGLYAQAFACGSGAFLCCRQNDWTGHKQKSYVANNPKRMPRRRKYAAAALTFPPSTRSYRNNCTSDTCAISRCPLRFVTVITHHELWQRASIARVREARWRPPSLNLSSICLQPPAWTSAFTSESNKHRPHTHTINMRNGPHRTKRCCVSACLSVGVNVVNAHLNLRSKPSACGECVRFSSVSVFPNRILPRERTIAHAPNRKHCAQKKCVAFVLRLRNNRDGLGITVAVLTHPRDRTPPRSNRFVGCAYLGCRRLGCRECCNPFGRRRRCGRAPSASGGWWTSRWADSHSPPGSGRKGNGYMLVKYVTIGESSGSSWIIVFWIILHFCKVYI